MSDTDRIVLAIIKGAEMIAAATLAAGVISASAQVRSATGAAALTQLSATLMPLMRLALAARLETEDK